VRTGFIGSRIGRISFRGNFTITDDAVTIRNVQTVPVAMKANTH
jgi:hypothetical protein